MVASRCGCSNAEGMASILDESTPLADKASWTLEINHCFVRGCPSEKRNKKPWPFPLTGRYAKRAVTGHNALLVLPRATSTPFLNRSVFDAFRFGFTILGLLMESMETSLKQRWVLGSKADSDGRVISPVRIKSKKHVETAAHHMIPSLSVELCWKCLLKVSRWSGVIGSSLSPELFLRVCWDLMPWITLSNLGIDAIIGSGRLLAICKCLTAKR